MKLKFAFSLVGLVIFALPMIINIAYVVFPPRGKSEQPAKIPRWIELTEKTSRIAYLLSITLFVSQNQISFHSVWLWLATLFLVLYYAVWIRYFISGRNIELLNRSFLHVPIPLAVFPVLYFLFAALWLNNIPAAIIMMIFAAAHITVSIKSFDNN